MTLLSVPTMRNEVLRNAKNKMDSDIDLWGAEEFYNRCQI